ncbi:hypothetical protein [Streptomyces sp. NPDC020996]|uniref:hypothetical protein n=1 Tax=Streptomyces sp. NPDC020996 TaxID=3154791 RepID=UPI0033EA0573
MRTRSRRRTQAASASPGAATLPSGAPSALPSLLALPVVRPEQAFPERAVRLADGSRYERMDLATTTRCADGKSQAPASLATRGPGSAGVFRRPATVRSVVFANGQWGDGSETREAQLTAETEGLLKYVDDKVAAYEEGREAGQ